MSDIQLIQNKILAAINGAKNTLLVCHKQPDGDAMGAICALICHLEKSNKKHMAFCSNQPVFYLQYLPRAEKIISEPQKILEQNFDLIIILDSGDLEHAGIDTLFPGLTQGTPVVINIDHHPTNTNFGHYNLVIPTASSTAEVVCRLMEHGGISLDKNMATCLLTGIITDTGNFSNPATTFAAIEAASTLLSRGARLPKIITNIQKHKTITDLKLWGKVLKRLKLNKRWRIATTFITQEDLREYSVSNEAIEGIANFLNNLGEAEITLLLKEQGDGKIKGSLRTTNDNINVAKIALYFGGGGHKKAAGFSVDGRLRKIGDSWEVA